MAKDIEPRATTQPKGLGAAYSTLVGILGLLTSVLGLVQLFTTRNVLLLTVLFAGVLAVAGVAGHHTWQAGDIRLRWLGTLTVAALVLASLAAGYGMGRATVPTTPATETTSRQSATSGTDGNPTSSAATPSADGTTSPASTRSTDAFQFARVTPASTDNFGSSGFDLWTTESVSVEAIEYDEAIVLSMIDCKPDPPLRVEYVLGRRYKRLAGKVTLVDDSPTTTPVPFVVVLDDKPQKRMRITTTPLELGIDLTGVNRIRFEFTPPGNTCSKYSKVAFVGMIAQP
ncbi:hypothetical protein ACIA5A_12090 [Micromonospora sp. NPDC051300]|uniref:hypothetical protein n=1 Tax=Micromonospora sp. NPDC051300 TaxID=3364286 RepID=UPI0037A4EA94